MKHKSPAVPDPNRIPLGPPRRTGAWLVAFILLALTPPGLEMAASVLHRETFDTDPAWRKGGDGAPWGAMIVTDGQAVLRFSRMEATDPDGLPAWAAGFEPPAPGWPVRFGPDCTIELRADVIQFSQEDAGAGVEVYGKVNTTGYTVVLERNEIVLNKFAMSPSGWAEAHQHEIHLVIVHLGLHHGADAGLREHHTGPKTFAPLAHVEEQRFEQPHDFGIQFEQGGDSFD